MGNKRVKGELIMNGVEYECPNCGMTTRGCMVGRICIDCEVDKDMAEAGLEKIFIPDDDEITAEEAKTLSQKYISDELKSILKEIRKCSLNGETSTYWYCDKNIEIKKLMEDLITRGFKVENKDYYLNIKWE